MAFSRPQCAAFVHLFAAAHKANVKFPDSPQIPGKLCSLCFLSASLGPSQGFQCDLSDQFTLRPKFPDSYHSQLLLGLRWINSNKTSFSGNMPTYRREQNRIPSGSKFWTPPPPSRSIAWKAPEERFERTTHLSVTSVQLRSRKQDCMGLERRALALANGPKSEHLLSVEWIGFDHVVPW